MNEWHIGWRIKYALESQIEIKDARERKTKDNIWISVGIASQLANKKKRTQKNWRFWHSVWWSPSRLRDGKDACFLFCIFSSGTKTAPLFYAQEKSKPMANWDWRVETLCATVDREERQRKNLILVCLNVVPVAVFFLQPYDIPFPLPPIARPAFSPVAL